MTVRSVEDGLLGYLDEIEGDRARARAAVRMLAARYSYDEVTRIVECAVHQGAVRCSDVFDFGKAPARLRAWEPSMREEAAILAGWDE